MKKFLLVLGMITCMVGLTACGNSAANTTSTSEFDEEYMVSIADGFMTSLVGVVADGLQEQYANDAAVSAALASYESAVADLGDYQSVESCTYVEDEKTLTATAVIVGSERKGTLELIYDVKDDYKLTSATINVTYTFGESMTKAGLNTLMGMGTVFVVLILIALLISCFSFIPKIQKAFSKKEKKVEVAAENAVAQIVQNEEVQEEDDLELVAVIAAAIAASEGAASTDGYVVRSIRRIR